MHYDLIVVGSGFASTFFLSKFLQKNENKKVLVLERGGLIPHVERLKIKRGDQLSYLSYNDASVYEMYENNNPEKNWRFSTGFGGSSNCWWGGAPRFMPSDFKLRSLYGVAQDWPISYEDLAPYYDEAEMMMSISGPDVTPFPRNCSYPMPPHKFSQPDSILHEKYGSLYIAQPCARPSLAVASKSACLGFSCCDTCPVNAKFTIENSCSDIYAHKNITLQFDSIVYEMGIEGNTARSVKYVKDEKEFEAFGDTIVLAANPIFNTNILLNSGDTNPLTGRGLGEQMGIQSLIYLKGMQSGGGSTWVNALGYMLYEGPHRKEYGGCLMEVNNAPYIRIEEGKWLDIMPIRLIYEDLPQHDNYITNTADKLKPKVYFNAGRSQYVLKAFEATKKQFKKILEPLPVEQIVYNPVESSEGHIIGGMPMGDSIENSVVNKFLQHHVFENVIVLGAGVFTTYGPSNPTLTLSALSLYAADKLF